MQYNINLTVKNKKSDIYIWQLSSVQAHACRKNELFLFYAMYESKVRNEETKKK